LYCCYPASSKDANLEQNMIKAPENNFTRFAMHSQQFMDAYYKGLDGKQAAWTTKKYKGHHVLPTMLIEDLNKAKLK
ncbi:hypothetical protein PAXRUDRAFT_176003, partial [Paxillus rubicundulus Ve08.2h10]